MTLRRLYRSFRASLIFFQLILDTIQVICINCCFIIALQCWALLRAYAGNKAQKNFFRSEITLNGNIMALHNFDLRFL